MGVTDSTLATGFAVTPTSLWKWTGNRDAGTMTSRGMKEAVRGWKSVGERATRGKRRADWEACGAGGRRGVKETVTLLRCTATFATATLARLTLHPTLVTDTALTSSGALTCLVVLAPFRPHIRESV